MASSISSVALVPVSTLVQRPPALLPAGIGTLAAPTTPFDPAAVPRAVTVQADTVRDEASREQGSDRPQSGNASPEGNRPSGSNAAFTAQLLAQDEPSSRTPSPFTEASRAYSRFQAAPDLGFVLDAPARVDLKI